MAEDNLEIQLLKKDIEKMESNLGLLSSDVKEVHSRITTVSRGLETRMQDLHDEGMNKVDQLRNDLQEERKSVHGRLRSLEQWKYTILGGLVVVGFLITLSGALKSIFE